jgi:hypothetical protein
MRNKLCRLTHWLGITFSMWSMRLQGDGPGPWPADEPEPVDMSNVFVVSFRER